MYSILGGQMNPDGTQQVLDANGNVLNGPGAAPAGGASPLQQFMQPQVPQGVPAWMQARAGASPQAMPPGATATPGMLPGMAYQRAMQGAVAGQGGPVSSPLQQLMQQPDNQQLIKQLLAALAPGQSGIVPGQVTGLQAAPSPTNAASGWDGGRG